MSYAFNRSPDADGNYTKFAIEYLRDNGYRVSKIGTHPSGENAYEIRDPQRIVLKTARDGTPTLVFDAKGVVALAARHAQETQL